EAGLLPCKATAEREATNRAPGTRAMMFYGALQAPLAFPARGPSVLYAQRLPVCTALPRWRPSCPCAAPMRATARRMRFVTASSNPARVGECSSESTTVMAHRGRHHGIYLPAPISADGT